MDRSVNIDDDGFVLVSKEAFKDDDAVSVRSDRSSLCMVDDPAADPGLFEDTDEDEGDRNAGKDVLESDASETAPLAKPEAIIQPERQSPKVQYDQCQFAFRHSTGIRSLSRIGIAWVLQDFPIRANLMLTEQFG